MLQVSRPYYSGSLKASVAATGRTVTLMNITNSPIACPDCGASVSRCLGVWTCDTSSRLAMFLSLGGCSGKQPEGSAADRLKRYEELNRLVEREGEKLYLLEQATQAAVPPVGTPAGQEWEKTIHSAQVAEQDRSMFACATGLTRRGQVPRLGTLQLRRSVTHQLCPLLMRCATALVSARRRSRVTHAAVLVSVRFSPSSRPERSSDCSRITANDVTTWYGSRSWLASPNFWIGLVTVLAC